jgi:hypothetical protein
MTKPTWMRDFERALHPRVQVLEYGTLNGTPAIHTFNDVYGQHIVWTAGKKGRVEANAYSSEFLPELGDDVENLGVL